MEGRVVTGCVESHVVTMRTESRVVATCHSVGHHCGDTDERRTPT
jgi:hypothetical protein